MKTLDDILKTYFPPNPTCEPKDRIARELRRVFKQDIEDNFEIKPRDKTQPYSPQLEYKEK